MNFQRFYFIFFSLAFGFQMSGQINQPSQEQKITIHSEDNQVVDATLNPPTQYLNGNVKVYHQGTYMFCDRAVLVGNDLKMYGNVALLQNDTIRIFADSIHYDGNTTTAFLFGDVILENGTYKKMYTSLLEYNTKNKIAYYNKNAKLIDGNSELISRRGRYLLNNRLVYFYENVEAKGTSFRLQTDSLSFLTDSQIATFLAPVRIDQDSSNIYSERGWFDLDDRNGDFIGNSQYVEGNSIAFADTLRFDGANDKISLLSEADKLSNFYTETDTTNANIIIFDRKNDTYELKKQAYYKSTENMVIGEYVFYDKKSEVFKVEGRSKVSDPPYIIDAEKLDYNKIKKIGFADGDVIWQDTAANTVIKADHIRYRGQENYLFAYNDTLRPTFISSVEGDSLFMKADTFKSNRLIVERVIYPNEDSIRLAKIKLKEQLSDSIQLVAKENVSSTLLNLDSIIIKRISLDTVYTGIYDTIDYFIGDNNVRIFKSDMQAVTDSLVMNNTDSLFTLYKNPIVWSDSSQIYGDTIDLVFANRKINQLKVRSKASILSTEDLIYYDQLSGQTLDAYFIDGKMNNMILNGNARVVYYLKDKEKAYIGVNITEASKMEFYMKEKKINDIKSYKEPVSKVLPMKSTDHNSIKIKDFAWYSEIRPISVESL